MRSLAIFLLFLLVRTAHAEDADWGVIPVEQTTTISFEAYDITKDFTDQYSFSILSGTDTSYSVSVIFDICSNGCGNPELSYGIYNANGGLVSESGSAVLSSGNYVFQVKGTGMGAGNSVDYSGSITFLVSAVPEPSDIALFLTASLIAGVAIRTRRTRNATSMGTT